MKQRIWAALTSVGIILAFASNALAQASVTTDQTDYTPGSTVNITGSGYWPGESVQLQVLNLTNPSENGSEYEPWTVTADANGDFQAMWLVTTNELGATLQLTAKGLSSGLTAQTTFTDGDYGTLTVGSQTGSLAYGSTATASFGIALSGKTGGNSVTVNLTVSGLPSGVTASFNPNGFNSSSSSTNSTLYVTNGTSTPVGSYTITVHDTSPGIHGTNTLTIGKQAVTVASGLTGNNKIYDGTATATIRSNNVSLNGVTSGDTANVALSTNGYSAAFTSVNVGTGLSVIVSGLSLTGTAATNYILTQPTLTANITPAGTTGTVTSSANPALPGATVWFTNRLTVPAPGGGTPTGSVIFKDGAAALGTVAVNSAGVAALSTSSLAHGSHTITAEYASNGNFTGTTNSLSPSQVINTPPVATSPTFTRQPGVSLKLLISALGTDTDGDTLSVTALGSGSQGATISHNSTYVFYLPASGNDNNDGFTYTISDGYGGTASGTVAVNVIGNQPGGASGSISVSNGVATVKMFGIPGFQYDVQRSLGLSTWTTLLTAPPLNPVPPFTASTNDGSFTFTDNYSDLGSPPSSAYYRAVLH